MLVSVLLVLRSQPTDMGRLLCVLFILWGLSDSDAIREGCPCAGFVGVSLGGEGAIRSMPRILLGKTVMVVHELTLLMDSDGNCAILFWKGRPPCSPDGTGGFQNCRVVTRCRTRNSLCQVIWQT